MKTERVPGEWPSQTGGWGLLLATMFLAILPLNHVAGLRHVLLLAVFVAAFLVLRRDWSGLPLKWWLLAWAGMTTASVAWSQNSMFSLREVKLEVLFGLMVFVGIYSQSRSLARGRMLMWGMLAGVMITALIAAYKILWLGVPSYRWSEENDPWGWMHGFISYSTYLVMVFPVILFLLLRQPGLARILSLAVLPLLLWVGWATQNRMFWVSLFGVLLVGAALWYARFLPRMRSKWLPALLISLALGVLVVGFGLVTQNRPADAMNETTGGGLSTLLYTFTRSERFEIWQYWLQQVPQNLWLGVGFGRDLPHTIFTKPEAWPVLMFAHAHNVFIDILLQLGVVGLTVFSGLLLAMTWRFWRYYRSRDEDTMWLGILGISILTAFVSKNFVDDLFWRTDALLFWALAGLVLGMGERMLQAGRNGASTER